MLRKVVAVGGSVHYKERTIFMRRKEGNILSKSERLGIFEGDV